MEEQAGGLNRGKKNRVFVNDPLIKIKEGVIKFYDLNEVFPKASKFSITRKYLSITTYKYNIFVSKVFAHIVIYSSESVIAMKAIAIQNNYLEEQKTSPRLSYYEVDAMTIFKASGSWAGKFARSQGWKSRAFHGEAGGVDVDDVEPEIAIL